jgi:hypothetical protein
MLNVSIWLFFSSPCLSLEAAVALQQQASTRIIKKGARKK